MKKTKQKFKNLLLLLKEKRKRKREKKSDIKSNFRAWKCLKNSFITRCQRETKTKKTR